MSRYGGWVNGQSDLVDSSTLLTTHAYRWRSYEKNNKKELNPFFQIGFIIFILFLIF